MGEKTQKLKKEIFLKLSSIKNLPVMPDMAVDIMSYSIDDDTSIKEIAKIISKDPSLAAQILKLANSAFYALKRKVGSLEKAIILLGLREIKNIIFALSVIKMFPQNKQCYFNKINFLKHSLITARTSDLFARSLQLRFEVSPFLAGLLHDIGKIFLDQNFHDEFNYVLKNSKNYDRNPCEVESEELGTDHAYIGGYIATIWNFPQELIDAIKFHHLIDANNENVMLVSIIYLSNLLANLRENLQHFPQKEACIFNLPAWKILAENCVNDDFDAEKFLFEVDDMIEKSEDIINLYQEGVFQG